MKLRDDAFLQDEPAPAPRSTRLTTAEREALVGVGDRHLREAQDFFAEPLPPAAHTAGGQRVSPGDQVEFTDPSGMRVSGQLEELLTAELVAGAGPTAVVRTGSGQNALVPFGLVSARSAGVRRSEKRDEIRQALRGGGGVGVVTETRAALPINASGRDFAITLQGWSGKPTEQDILEYVAARYPGAQVLDADGTEPGNKVGVVIHLPEGLTRTAQGMIPIESPKYLPSDKPEGAGLSQEFVDDKPVTLEAERRRALLEKTGQALTALAASNPTLTLYETSVETDAQSVVSHFSLYQDGSPVFLRAAGVGLELTRVLAPGSAPATGYAVASEHGLRVALHGPTGEVEPKTVQNLVAGAYDSMSSPATLSREDAPGAYEHGSYVTKADAPPPGAADWKSEMAKHREESERQLLEQQRRKELRRLHPTTPPTPAAPWLETAPLAQQVHGDEDREHIGGPGVAVAGVDPTAKSYWHGYFDTPATEGYDKPLTDDVERKKRTKARVTASWKTAGARLTAPHLFAAMQLFTEQPAPAGSAKALLEMRASSAHAAELIDQIVADFLARNPDVLGKVGFAGALEGALAFWDAYEPRRTARLRHAAGPRTLAIRTAWAVAAGAPPTESELAWALDVIGPRQAQDLGAPGAGGVVVPDLRGPPSTPPGPGDPAPAPDAPAAGPTPATATPPAPSAPPTDLANALIEAMHRDPRAQASIDKAMAGFLGKLTPLQRSQINPRDPATLQKLLPSALGGLDQKARDQLGFRFAPQLTPGAQQSGWQKFKNILPGTENQQKTRQQHEQGRSVQELLGQTPGAPTPGAPPAAAPPVAAPAPAPAPAAPAPSAGPAAPSPAQPAGQAGLPDLARMSDDQLQQLGTAVGQEALRRNPRQSDRREAYTPLGPQEHADDMQPDEREKAQYDGRRPPATAQLGFKLENLRRSGDYALGDVVWDPERTRGMSAKNIEHNVISFVKGRSTMKDARDLGNIGRVRVRKLDLHAGMAEVQFRSSEARALPPEQLIVEEGVNLREPHG